MIAHSKLSPFDKIDLAYKTVHGVAISVSFLIPKHLRSKPKEGYPIIVNWHGGGLVLGHRLYEAWLPDWCVKNQILILMKDELVDIKSMTGSLMFVLRPLQSSSRPIIDCFRRRPPVRSWTMLRISGVGFITHFHNLQRIGTLFLTSHA